MKKKILVVGDVMLDKYIFGSIEKISQEAPTAVLNVISDKNENIRLGGAANVAANVKSLGSDVTLVSLTGNDYNSKILKNILKKKKIKYYFFQVNNFFITEKTRIVCNNQQMIRLDKDSPNIVVYPKLFESKFNKLLKNINYLIISDYNKGSIKNIKKIINLATKKKIKVLIDSKNKNTDLYKNSFLVKPNLKEFEKMFNTTINEPKINYIVIKLLKKLNISYLLVTLGKDGMKLFSKHGVKEFSSKKKEVFDVTGAGDTVLAALAVHLSKSNNIVDSVQFALNAAETVISKFGTATVSEEEINNVEKKQKLLKLNDLIDVILEEKKKNKKIVFTNGCFDILHAGHIHILKEAKKRGDILIIGLNSDISIKKNKGLDRPIVKEIDRSMHLEALEFVDYITIFDDKTPNMIIKKINPDVLVKGSEYKFKTIAGSRHVTQNKGKIVLIKKYKNYSTTNILKRIVE
jgi:D-beta-D-heptose 7-phosphate kinase/D-beta-D-heptose 1-phosphate adenosyltransferase